MNKISQVVYQSQEPVPYERQLYPVSHIQKILIFHPDAIFSNFCGQLALLAEVPRLFKPLLLSMRTYSLFLMIDAVVSSLSAQPVRHHIVNVNQ